MAADVIGLCTMCGQPGPMHTCSLCGRLVCERCYDRRHMVCTECNHQRRHADSPFYPMD